MLTRSTLVVTLRDSQLVGKLLQTGLIFGGKVYKVGRYWEAGRGEVCPKCCRFGHYKGCEEERCYLCGQEGHTANTHKCSILDCGSRRPCFHMPKKCANCKGGHLATSNKCPKKWENIRGPLPLQPKPRLLDRVEIPVRPYIRSSPPTIGPTREENPTSSPTPIVIPISSSPLPSIELPSSTSKDIEMGESPLPENFLPDTQHNAQTLSSSRELEEDNNSNSPIINVNLTT